MSIFGLPVHEESVSAVTATPSVYLGRRRVDAAGNEYVYGYNAGSPTIYPGVPVVHASNNTGYSFSVTNAASQVGWIAAVCHHATVPAGSYAWFMVKGLSRMVPDGSQVSFNAGADVGIGVDGGFVDMSGATLSTGLRFGYSVESIVTGYGSCASEATSGLGCLGRGWIKTVLG